jgi:hypothetical protein
MADYLPIYKPGQAITLKASATITGGQIVAVTGAGTVGPAGAASAAWVGVAAFDAATNDNVTIYTSGVQLVTASGTVTAGDAVNTAASGQVVTNATPSTQGFVGIALSTATSGNKVRVLFAR